MLFAAPRHSLAGGRAVLIQRLDQLRQYQLDPAVVDTLGQFLQHAPDQEIARIRPRAFAERFGLIPEQVSLGLPTCVS